MIIFAKIIAALEEAEKAEGTIFDDFVDAHSGLEHVAGASKGGTFFLVGGSFKDDASDDSPWSILHGDESTGHVDEDDGGDDVLYDGLGADSITLLGVNASDLNADDFIF